MTARSTPNATSRQYVGGFRRVIGSSTQRPRVASSRPYEARLVRVSEAQDVQTLGGSRNLRKFLDDLRDGGHINELVDGYRLCIATACAFQRVPDLSQAYDGRTTMFAPTTLDTGDFAIRTAIAEIYPEVANTPYRA